MYMVYWFVLLLLLLIRLKVLFLNVLSCFFVFKIWCIGVLFCFDNIMVNGLCLCKIVVKVVFVVLMDCVL